MKLRLLLALVSTLSIASCGENSDGSDKSTYSSCSIISSEAVTPEKRANDVSQCWDGVNYKEKSLALDWCNKKVTAYLGAEYGSGGSPAVQFKLASTNCP